MSMIRVEKLSKAFGSLQVLKDVDLTVEKGERIVIIGGSGCGKSVFLRCMDFLEIPDEGAVFLGDDELTTNQKDLNRIRRKVGMVFQGFHLFSHMNVLDNITLAPIKLLGLSREEAEKKAAGEKEKEREQAYGEEEGTGPIEQELAAKKGRGAA